MLTVNPLSDDDLRQSTATVYGMVSDSSYDVWVSGVEAYYVDDEGDWEADGVPVNGNGIAAFDVTAYSPGAAPAMRGYFHPLDDGGGEGTVSQSLVAEMPSLVQVSSYQSEYYQNNTLVRKCGNQWRGMSHPLESQHRSSFLEFTALQMQVRPHIYSFRTFQHKGHPHPVLSRSTPEVFLWVFHRKHPGQPS